VSPVKTTTVIIEISISSPDERSKKLIKIATIIPMSAMLKNFPNLVRSVLVLAPYRLMLPNMSAEIKNICVIDLAVYTRKILERVSPFKIA